MTQFVYEPLETETSIRLVFLPAYNSNPDHGKLQLQLQHYELSEVHGKYCALSYVWGNPAKTHTVRLNDADFRVTENLKYFLQRKRSQDSPEAFWIDAICINQDDDREKNVQIPLMCAIYENAAWVHAELGPAPSDERNAIRHLQQIHSCIADQFKNASTTIYGVTALRQLKLPYTDPYESEIWNEIGEFFEHPWWYRAWIMQEATATKHTTLFYGTMTLTWLELIGVNVGLHVFRLKKPWPSHSKPKTGMDALSRLTRLQSLRAGKELRTRTLLGVLKLFRGLSASDPRDMVYAGLGIANDQVAIHIQPDYRRSVFETYRDVVASQLQFSSDPSEFLAHCGTRFQDLDALSIFPSWIPQWQGILRRSAFCKYSQQDDGSRSTLYNVCRFDEVSTTHSAAQSLSMEVRGRCLHTKGVLLERIVRMHRPCCTIQFAEVPSFVNTWMPSDPDEPYIAGGTRMEAFTRTLVADLEGDIWKSECVQRGGQAEWDAKTNGLLINDINERNLRRVHYLAQDRGLAVSEAGYFALVSHQAREGDLIFLFSGCPFLYTLRRKGDKYLFVGECYVHGLMDGEAISLLESGSRSLEDIVII